MRKEQGTDSENSKEILEPDSSLQTLMFSLNKRAVPLPLRSLDLCESNLVRKKKWRSSRVHGGLVTEIVILVEFCLFP